MKHSQYDVIIVGGGMVGLTLACALAQQTTLSIAIIEAQPHAPTWSASQYSHRVSTISLSSRRILQSLNSWKAVTEKRVSPFSKIEIWDAAGKVDTQFEASDIGELVLGFVVENNALQTALEEKINQYPQIHYFPGTKLAAFKENETAVVLTDENGRTYQARLAIAADGTNSWLRQQAAIDIKKEDYAQMAIVATVKTELPHQQVARQAFLNSGPLAFLPLVDAHTSSCVWSVPTLQAKALMALDDDAFRQQLAEAFSSRLGKVIEIDQRYAFPLCKQQAKQYVKSRVVLIGDAAHTMHPLAGQGVNMGLLDAASLAEVMIDALTKQKPIDNRLSLRHYERWRRAENANLLIGVDIIKHIFASEKNMICSLRSAGLNIVNRLSWIKGKLIRHAVGDRGGLPKLACQVMLDE